MSEVLVSQREAVEKDIRKRQMSLAVAFAKKLKSHIGRGGHPNDGVIAALGVIVNTIKAQKDPADRAVLAKIVLGPLVAYVSPEDMPKPPAPDQAKVQ